LRGPPPDRAWWVPDPSRLRRLVGASSPRLVLRLRSPRHRRWVVRADGSASCLPPQGVPRLLVCRTPYLGSVLHARMRVHQSLAHARCPIVCTSLSHRPSAAPPALQELLDHPLQAAALIAFESVFKQRSSRLNQPQSEQPSPSSPSSLQTALSSPSRAGCPSPAPRPGRARRRGPVACRRPTGLARRGRGAPPVRPGQACARRAAWGVRADPKRGHQREHGGRGWADGGR
jgi:hypothetical protein